MNLAKALLNPSTNRVIADLDNTASMSSIVMRDLIDNAGRVTQAYRRDSHEGREEAIEQNATTLIWGFGIRYLKQLFDTASKKLAHQGIGNVHLPKLNMTLFDEGPQKLTSAVIKKYTVAHSSTQKHLMDLITKKQLLTTYQSANVIKFGVATFLPVVLIAFGIPTLKQWITRNKLQDEKLENFEKQKKLKNQSIFNFNPQISLLRKPKTFQQFHQKANFSAYKTSSTHPKFSGINPMNYMYHLLQNERANTLLIDGTISGGRTYKARNIYERLEIIFSEMAVIYFLFFAATPLQKSIQKILDKTLGIHTQLEFQGLKHIHDTYGKNAQNLIDHFKLIEQEMGSFKSFEGQTNKAEVIKTLAEFETNTVSKARDYTHTGSKGHLLFDLAQRCHFIPTLKTPEGKIVLDLTHPIKTDDIYRLGQHVKQLIQSAEEKGFTLGASIDLQRLIKKSLVGKFGAFGLTTGICTAFLGWIIPRSKQKITHWLTGKDQFPGLLNQGERQDFLSVGYR